MTKSVQKRRLSVLIVTIFSTLLLGCKTNSPSAGEQLLETYWNRFFLEETKMLVRIPTYRQEDHPVNEYLQQAQDLLQNWAITFNDQELTNLKLRYFEWDSGVEEGSQQPPKYKVFGFRVGNGPQKVSLLTHIDVVPPGNSEWGTPSEPQKPFEAQEKTRDYQPSPDNELRDIQQLWGKQDFLVGRGTIDDKGPTVTTFTVLRALAKQFDSNPEALNGVTLELLFDTSEETEMSTHHYMDDPDTVQPNLGIVFDGMWCVRAEKGIERPTFSVARTPAATHQGLWIENLYSGENGINPANQIPDTATAIIKADDANMLTAFCYIVTNCYKDEKVCPLVPEDERPYRRAPLNVMCDKDNNQVTLTTDVIGVQHGSGPQENRANGANPLVSLTNFLAYLVYEVPGNNDSLGIKLVDNDFAKMARFIRWGWGTQAFGEKHPSLLERHDNVFVQGNGTTYAITKLETKNNIELGIDVRYAINHHINGEWEGSQGFLAGKISKFGRQGETCRHEENIVNNDCIFQTLVNQFNEVAGTQLRLEDTKTVYPPEIRNPDESPEFQKINTAFKDVMGQNCPQIAVGGGTDAKNHLQLWAAGALFDTKLGPPINFHGQNEGAPVAHLKTSAKIMYRLMCNEIEACK